MWLSLLALFLGLGLDRLIGRLATPAGEPGFADHLLWGLPLADGRTLLNVDGSLSTAWSVGCPDYMSCTDSQLIDIGRTVNQAFMPLVDRWLFHYDVLRVPAPDYPPAGAFPDPVSLRLDGERRRLFSAAGHNFVSRQVLFATFSPPPPVYDRTYSFFVDRPGPTASHDWRRSFDEFREGAERLEQKLSRVFELTPLATSELASHLRACLTGRLEAVAVPPGGVALRDLLLAEDFVGGFCAAHRLRQPPPRRGQRLSPGAREGCLRSLPLRPLLLPLLAPHLSAQPPGGPGHPVAPPPAVVQQGTRAQPARHGRSVLRRPRRRHGPRRRRRHDRGRLRRDPLRRLYLDPGGERCGSGRRGSEGPPPGRALLRPGFPDRRRDAQRHRRLPRQPAGARAPQPPAAALEPAQHRRSAGHHLAPPRSRPLPVGALSPGLAADPVGDHRGDDALPSAPDPRQRAPRADLRHDPLGQERAPRPARAPGPALARVPGLPFRRRLLLGLLHPGGRRPTLRRRRRRRERPVPAAGSDRPARRVAVGPRLAAPAAPAAVVGSRAADRARPAAGARAAGPRARGPAHPDPASELRPARGGQGRASPLHRPRRPRRAARRRRRRSRHRPAPGVRDDPRHALKHPSISVPVLLYLFHRIEQRLRQGRPSHIFIEEAWLPLLDTGFAAQIDAWLRRLAKLNAGVWLVTQSPQEVVAAPNARVVLDSCLSRILLPDPHARDAGSRDLYERLGLNPKEIDLLARAEPRRHYLHSTPSGSRLFELALDRFALALLTPPPGKTVLQMYRLALERRQRDGESWFGRYLEENGLPDFAGRLEASQVPAEGAAA